MISKMQDALGAAAVMQMTDLAVGGSPAPAPAVPANSGQQAAATGVENPVASGLAGEASPAAVVDEHLSTQLQAREISEAAKAKSEAAEQERKEKAGKDKPVDESQMTYLMKEINRIMSRMNCNIAFEYHKEVDVMSVRMLEKKTGKLIKEMPPEYMIKGMEKTREWLGTFLDQPA